MNKLIKKIIISALTVIIALGLAVGCDTPHNNVSGEYFSPAYYASNVTAENGTAEYAEQTLVGSQKLVKGMVLSGETGAKFNLGSVNITKSNWNGDIDFIESAATPFISYYYAPTKKEVQLPSLLIKLTDSTNELNFVEIYVNGYKQNKAYTDNLVFLARAGKQEQFGSYLNSINTTFYEGDPFNHTKSAAFKSAYLGKSAEYMGYEEGATVAPNGTATAPVSLVYDSEDVCLYSPVSSTTENANVSHVKSYAIRNFLGQYKDKIDASDAKWQGFKSGIVNVSVEFVETLAPTKIVVTNVGGYEISNSQIFVPDADYVVNVPNTEKIVMVNTEVTFNAPAYFTPINSKHIAGSKLEITKEGFSHEIAFTEATAKYRFTEQGVYNLKFKNAQGEVLKEDSLKVASVTLNSNTLGVKTSAGATAEYGAYKQAASNVYYTGVKLTGGSNAKFDLGTISLSETWWNYADYDYDYDVDGDNTKMENTSVFESFINLVYHPTADRTVGVNPYYGEVDYVYVTLTDVNDPTQFVTIRLGDTRQDDKSAIAVDSIATNNPTYAGQRYFGTESGIVLNSKISKRVSCRGAQEHPIELVYDEGAVYTTSTLNAAGLKGAYCIRNYTYSDEMFSEYDYNIQGNVGNKNSYHRDTHTYWGGFTSNKVNVTVSFGKIRSNVYKGLTSTSVIITKLGRHDLTSAAVEIEDSEYVSTDISVPTTAYAGEDITLQPAYEKWHSLHAKQYQGCYAEVYLKGSSAKIDTVTFNGKPQALNLANAGVYEIKYFDSSGTQIGSTKTITVVNPPI